MPTTSRDAFRPSILAWRDKYKAEKAAQPAKPATTTPAGQPAEKPK